MGDLLKTLKTAVQKQMLEGTAAHFVPRGFAMPIDPFLEGVVRTGKKISFQVPLVAPDNKYTLLEDAVYDTDRVVVDRDPDWIDAGAYVTIGERELHEVEDVVDNVIIFSSNLLADHQATTAVYHHSNPVFVEGVYAAGNTYINVDLPYFIVRGDVIGISPDTDLNISFVEYTVLDARFVGTDSTGQLNQYLLQLDKPIHRSLAEEEVIQLLAYPAYISRALPIPQPDVSDLPVVGPYLIDWLSAPFLNDMNVTEYQTLQRLNDLRQPIGSPVSIEKNHQILYVPIRADQFLFWTKVNGSIKYDAGVNKMVAIPDSDGYWQIYYSCVPLIDVPSTSAQGLIIVVPTVQLLNNEGFRLTDDVDSMQFEYQVDGTYVKTTETPAQAIITATGIPTDNETFILDDGFGTVVTFEFQATNGFVATAATNRIVDVRTSVLATDVAIAMEQAVNAVAALGITASNLGAVLTLDNDQVSLLGNTTIVETSAALTITQQFLGGTDPVETIDVSAVTTAIDVAKLTAAAVLRSGLHFTATFPTIAPSVPLQSTVEGTGGNQPITETVADAGFSVQGMSGGSGGHTWSFQVTPAQDILLRIRLSPNGWQDYNLTGGTTHVVAVNLNPADEQVERIELLVKGVPGTEVLFGDWGIRGARVSALQHTYVAHVKGERNFASTGLMVKPLFHSKEDLQVKYDSGENFGSGGIRI